MEQKEKCKVWYTVEGVEAIALSCSPSARLSSSLSLSLFRSRSIFAFDAAMQQQCRSREPSRSLPLLLRTLSYVASPTKHNFFCVVFVKMVCVVRSSSAEFLGNTLAQHVIFLSRSMQKSRAKAKRRENARNTR
jgi:hypothetical protein